MMRFCSRIRRQGVPVAAGILAAWLAVSRGAEPAPAPAPAPGGEPSRARAEFVRFVPEGSQAGRVETVVKVFRNAEGAEVTLFAAVHIGDPAYYVALQQRFAACDALLYEMIGDGATVAPGERLDTANPVSQLQIGMKRMLNLEFQLEAIDYSPTNFVHADLDPATFFRLQRERGESLMSLVLQAMIAEQTRLNEGKGSTFSSLHLLMALMNPDRGYALKLVLGRQMSDLEDQLAGIEKGAHGQGSVIVSARNERVIEVLQRELGQGRRQLGIFYGAGHMPDLEQRLGRLGFSPAREEWLTAWDIRPKEAKPAAAPPAATGP